jgi:hypothetical protein
VWRLNFVDTTCTSLGKSKISYITLKLNTLIKNCCEFVLGSYVVDINYTGKSLDTLELTNEDSYTKTVKNFKKAIRITSRKIVPQDHNTTALDDAYNHLFNLYGTTESQTPKDQHEKKSYQKRSNFKDYFTVDNQTLYDKVTAYASHKSCGMDEVHAICLKVLIKSEKFTHHLRSLYQLCFDFGYTPARWNNALVHPIPKSKEATVISDYRPISLTVMFRRIFESILHSVLMNDLESIQALRLSSNQAGFKKRYSTTTHAASSNDISYKHRNLKRVFIDLKQAYDRVDFNILLRKHCRKLPERYILLINSLFSKCSLTVQINKLIPKIF